MNQGTTILKIEHIDAGYGRKQVLHDVSLKLQSGSVTGLIGSNGAGKSTLLSVLGGTLRQWKGEISYHEQDISKEPILSRSNHGIGFLLPGAQVFPSMTVSENLHVALSLSAESQAHKAQKEEAFNWFPNLHEKADLRAGLLSIGERQMLALSMVLIQKPKVLLLDEPVEGIAQDLASKIMNEVSEYVQDNNITALVVEHNTTLIIKYCTTIHFMSQGCIHTSLQSSEPDVEEVLTRLYFDVRQK